MIKRYFHINLNASAHSSVELPSIDDNICNKFVYVPINWSLVFYSYNLADLQSAT